MIATAIEIELSIPLRITNLANLRRGAHLNWDFPDERPIRPFRRKDIQRTAYLARSGWPGTWLKACRLVEGHSAGGNPGPYTDIGTHISW
jgi:hypothetical protein